MVGAAGQAAVAAAGKLSSLDKLAVAARQSAEAWAAAGKHWAMAVGPDGLTDDPSPTGVDAAAAAVDSLGVGSQAADGEKSEPPAGKSADI